MVEECLDRNRRTSHRASGSGARRKEQTVKRMIRQPLALMLVLVMGLLAIGVSSRVGNAQTGTPPAAGKGFVGTWQVAGTVAGKPTGFRFATWLSDGTLFTTGPVVTQAAPGSPNKLVYNSTAHGEWYATGPNTATATFSWMRSDENGNFLGTTTIHLNSTLAADGQSFHNDSTVVITDASGKVVSTTPSTGDGKRLSASPPDLSATGTPAA
jgi:hypothetical protein